MYDFIQNIEEIVSLNRGVGGHIKERVFYLNGLLGMGPKEIVSNGYFSQEELAALLSLQSKKTKQKQLQDKIKYISDTLSSSLSNILIDNKAMQNSLTEYLSSIGFFECAPSLDIDMDRITDLHTDAGTRMRILAYAYFSYKMKFTNEVLNSSLHTRDILYKQYGVPLVPLVYGDYNSAFKVNRQMASGTIPLKTEASAEVWPPMLPINEHTNVSDYYYLLVLAIGWDKFLRAAVVDNRDIWNGLLYRVRDHQPVIGDDRDTQQAVLSLQLTSYVATLGSNYGLVQSNTEECLQIFAVREKRRDFADLLEKRWNDFRYDVRFSSQLTEVNISQMEYVISSLRMDWPKSVEESLIETICNVLQHERENPYDLRNSKLANPLSANLIVHGMRNNQDIIILQNRNKKKVGHGYVTLQASAAGFVSPYLDTTRSAVNTTNPDLLNTFYTESRQELGEINFDQINIHGVFRDLINFEVGMAASAYSRNVTVTLAREAGNEVSSYYFVNNNSRNIFKFMDTIKAEENGKDIWGSMMPLGLSALLSYLASDAGWKAVFDDASEAIHKDLK